MARPRGDDVRRQIVLATFECVAQRGVEGMSVREVARATGLSSGTVTYHFASRRSLLMDAIGYGYWRLPPRFETRDAATALSLVLRRYVLADRKRRTWWQFWLAVTSCAQTDAEVRAELGRQHTSIIERWRYCLDRGIAEGTFEPGLDTQVHAQRLTAYAHGLAVSQLIDPGQTGWAEAELRHAVDVLRLAGQRA